MNWVWPMAPAHEPIMWPASMSPAWMIFRAAMSSPRAQASRRPSKPRVASALSVGVLPKLAP